MKRKIKSPFLKRLSRFAKQPVRSVLLFLSVLLLLGIIIGIHVRSKQNDTHEVPTTKTVSIPALKAEANKNQSQSPTAESQTTSELETPNGQTGASQSSNANHQYVPQETGYSAANDVRNCSQALQEYYASPAPIGSTPPFSYATLSQRTLEVNSDGYAYLSFSAPDGMGVNYVTTSAMGAMAEFLSGQYYVDISLRISSTSSMPDEIYIHTMCTVYTQPLAYTYVPKPTINVTTISFDQSTNSIHYSIDQPLSSLSLSYVLSDCKQVGGTDMCSGYTMISTVAQDGVLSLDPYFPQIDQYFSLYPPTSMQLYLVPISSNGLEVGNVGSLTFTLKK